MTTFTDILDRFCTAVEAADYDGFAQLFTEDGVYDDIFFGEFGGRAAIADMLRKFHEGGENFKWQMFEPAEGDGVGYARWMFSYDAKVDRAKGQRVTFEGVGQFHLRDGLIARYQDFCNGAVPLAQMNTPPELMTKMIGRWQKHLETRPGYSAHQK